MSRICFAILAHHKRDCLQDLIENLSAFAPSSTSVLFNGGTDPGLGANLGILVCPYSRPIKWGWLSTVILDVMQWITSTEVDYQYLVYLDSDMLLVKHGFEEFIEDEMRDYDYMAVKLREIRSPHGWVPAMRFLPKWPRIWQPLFKLDVPLGCLHGGQVFTRRCVKAMLSHPRLTEIRHRAVRSGVPALEELLYPNLAASAGCRLKPYPLPQGDAIRWKKYHCLDELVAYRDGLPVYLIHPVSMDFNSPDRQFIRLLSVGANLKEGLQELFSDWPPPLTRRTGARKLLTHLRTLWIRLKRE